MNGQEELDVVTEFRRQLEGLPEPRRRALRLIPFAAAAVVVAVAIVALLAGSGDSTPQALAISRQADWIELRIADASASPAEMNRELEAAGIDGRIVLAPVSPERVGVWILTSQTAASPKCVVPEGQTAPDISRKNSSLHKIERIPNVNPKALRVPIALVRESSAAGSEFLFVAGRPARAGERVVDSIEAEDRLLETLEPRVRTRIARPIPTCKPGQKP
jgi:hypothetical protein